MLQVIDADEFVEYFNRTLSMDTSEFELELKQFMEVARSCRATKSFAQSLDLHELDVPPTPGTPGTRAKATSQFASPWSEDKAERDQVANAALYPR